MRALTGLLRTNEALGGLAARAFGSVVSAEASSPFVKYASPVPTPIDYSPLLASLPETQVTTLSNGMRVATESNPAAETATLGLWISSGSRYETDATNGAANLLEHVLFKGTKKHSAKDLSAAVDSIGGKLSACTGRELTAYWASGVLGKDVAKGVDILSDVLLNPKLDDADIASARTSILAQLKEADKPAKHLVFDHLHATAFQHSPLGRTVAGPAGNLRSLGKQQLLDYVKTHYRGPRIVLVGTGAVNHDELVKKASEAFGAVPDEDPSTSVRSMVQKEPALYTGSYVHDRFPNASECSFAVGFKGPGATDADSVPLAVVQQLLGSWDKKVGGVGKHVGSRLVQTVTAEDLADSMSAFNLSYHDSGLFGVYGVTDRERCEDLAYNFMMAMTKLCYDVHELDVLRAKAQLKANLLLGQGSNDGLATSIGRDLLLYGRRIPRAELFARIDAVDGSTIQAVADRFIYDQDMVVAAVGDVQFMPDYNWFRRRSYLLRY